MGNGMAQIKRMSNAMATWAKDAGLFALTMSCRVQVAFRSGLCSHHCLIVLRFACSVASLSRCLSHYLPGCLDLHHGILAGYLLGWGSPSTRSAWHAVHAHAPLCRVHYSNRRWSTPQRGGMKYHLKKFIRPGFESQWRPILDHSVLFWSRHSYRALLFFCVHLHMARWPNG